MSWISIISGLISGLGKIFQAVAGVVRDMMMFRSGKRKAQLEALHEIVEATKKYQEIEAQKPRTKEELIKSLRERGL